MQPINNMPRKLKWKKSYNQAVMAVVFVMLLILSVLLFTENQRLRSLDASKMSEALNVCEVDNQALSERYDACVIELNAKSIV
jgi:hypothetical protein